MIGAIALHEWRRLRAGMMFWLLLAFGQLIVAWLSFAQLETFAGIAPGSVPAFVALQLAGLAVGVALTLALYPRPQDPTIQG